MSNILTLLLLSWNTIVMDPNENQQQAEIATADEQQAGGTQPVRKRNLKKLILIFIIVFIVIVVAGLGVVIFSLQNIKSSKGNPLDNPMVMKLIEKMPVPKITMVQITPIAPTENTSVPQISTTQPVDIQPKAQNWNTYKNISLNFSLKYPSDCKLHENSQGLGVEEISFNSPENKDPENSPDYQILVYPKSFGKLIGQDFDEIYALPISSTMRLSSEGSSPQQFTKKANKTIKGLRAIEYISTADPPNPGEEEEVGYYIEYKDSVLIITTINSNKGNLDYMVSTFKSS